MKSRAATLLSLLVLLAGLGGAAHAAHTEAQLVLSMDSVRPGYTLWAGVVLRMEPGWHTYWRNSGASGVPTSIQWKLPPGITAGDIRWPVPEKLPPDDLTTYIYSGETVLMVPLTIASNAAAGALDIAAKVSWLECKEQCLPGKANVAATLIVAPSNTVSSSGAVFETWIPRLPARFDPETGILPAEWAGPARDDLRPISLPVDPARQDFYPDASDQFEVQGGSERWTNSAGSVVLRKWVKKFSGDWPHEIPGLLVDENGKERTGADVRLQLVTAPPAEPPAAAPAAASPLSKPLWLMLLYGFLGGIILNVMPCVLPVIALKILGFVREASSDARRVRALGLSYTAGVLASFLVLALLVIAVKTAGRHASWGMQFGNPRFVVLLTVLVTGVALNLFGVFEVNPGSHILNAAGSAAARSGLSGAFFNGILATVLATPCTAPFLGSAVGFALAQPAGILVLMFLMVGFGLAMPYMILSWNPDWLAFLPKPGAWMERFKIAMGFPMLATAVWLFSLMPAYYGERSWWLGIFLVVFAAAAWVFGEFAQRSRRRPALAMLAALVLLAGGYGYAIERGLNWRAPVDTSAAQAAAESGDIPWAPWSAAAVERAQAEGRPVLVDFTASWCLTCQANKRLAIDIPSVRAKLKSLNAAALLGDYTRVTDDITVELAKYGRAGVPLVLVFPGKPGAPPVVLPELLTPGIMLDALDKAGARPR